MHPLFEHRLELAGYTTRALELEGDGPPLLLLHGFADSADTWRPALDGLARAGRRALALDMPGFGAAARLKRDAGVLEQLDAFAAAAVEHLAAEVGADVWVAGNSLGGCVALRLAERGELPLAGVVPVAPAGFDHPGWFGVIDAQPVVRVLLGAPVPLPQALVRGMVGGVYRQLAFARPRAIAPEIVAGFSSHMATPRDVRRTLATGRRLMPEIAGNRAFALDRIAVPVVLVWGDRDRMVTHKGSRHLVAAIPGMRYELLEGVGHCPQLEAPERFCAILLDATAAPAAA